MSRQDKWMLVMLAVVVTATGMVATAWDAPPEETPAEPPARAAEAAPDKRAYPVPEDLEDELIEAALVSQGYFRDDVPLSYDLQDHAQTACEAYGVPYPLLLGVMEVESGFDPEAVSSKGCYGLMQLNPKYFPAGLEPWQNVWAGAEFLGELLEKYDAVEAALTAYNAGHDTGSRIYASKVLAAAEVWKEALK